MKPRISYDHQIRLPIVALVIKATLAFITGKFETIGSNFSNETALLAACVPATIPREVYFKNKHTKKTLQASPLESQRVNKSKFLKNYFAAS